MTPPVARTPPVRRTLELDALTFDDATHVYRCEGIVIPSVTQVLSLVPPRSRLLQFLRGDDLEAKRQLGTAVHAAAHFYDEGTLNPETVDEQVLPYLDGWIKFLREADFVPEQMETLVLHPYLGYAGRFDRLGRRRGGKRVLLDIKTGDPGSAAAGPQTAAYLEAWLGRLGHWEPVDRLSVQLRADGTYAEHPHEDRSDFEFFKAALTIFAREGSTPR